MLVTPDSATCLMILVRHGATKANLAKPARLQGRTSDPSLSPTGRQQATAVATLLESTPLAAAFSSPLIRAQETAQMIVRSHDIRVSAVDGLTEVDVGAWEGWTWEEVADREPEAYTRFQQQPHLSGYRGGEDLEQVRRRVLPAFRDLFSHHLGKVILVVAHNVVNRVFLADLLGLPVASARKIPQDNGGVNIIRQTGEALKLMAINPNPFLF